jgi:hypothetical protein
VGTLEQTVPEVPGKLQLFVHRHEMRKIVRGPVEQRAREEVLELMLIVPGKLVHLPMRIVLEQSGESPCRISVCLELPFCPARGFLPPSSERWG